MVENKSSPASIAERFVEALIRKDPDGIAACYAPDAVIWHSHDMAEQSVADNIASYRVGLPRLGDLFVEVVRRWASDTDCVQQQILRAIAPNGQKIILPMMVRYQCENGHIVRLEEYFDATPLGALGAAPAPGS